MINQLLSADLQSGVLQCPDCHASALAEVNDQLCCGSCDAVFPLINSVPLLLPSSHIRDNHRRLVEQLNLPAGSGGALLMALGSALAFGLTSGELAAEFGNVAGRFPDIFGVDASGMKRQETTVDDCETGLDYFDAADISAVAPVFCKEFRPGEARFRAIRITNGSKLTLASNGPQPWHLSYHLYDASGALIEYNGLRSKFPISVFPGTSLTVPVRINAPPNPGRYRIVIVLMKEFVRWFDENPLYTTEIEVRQDCRSFLRDCDISSEPFDFVKDTQITGEMYESMINKDQAVNRVLEVACRIYPVALRNFLPNTKVTALDLCFPELQIAALVFRDTSTIDSKYFICGDAMNMPLSEGQFDYAVICAALHHFSQPVLLLKQIHSKLKVNGRLLVAREPCFVDPDATAYLRDLEGGFNEQQFEVEDFMQAFTDAGFRCERLRIDFAGSLKAVLAKDSVLGSV